MSTISGVLTPPTVASAEGKIVELLRTLDLAREAWDSRSNGNGGPILMPSLYHDGSYDELEKRLAEMRESAATKLTWWHTTRRWRYVVEVGMLVKVVRRARGPELMLPPRCELMTGTSISGDGWAKVTVRRWHELVDEGRAWEGVEHLKARMHGGDVEQIRLPDPLLRRALGMSERVA